MLLHFSRTHFLHTYVHMHTMYFSRQFSGGETGKCVDYVPQLATERVVKV